MFVTLIQFIELHGYINLKNGVAMP